MQSILSIDATQDPVRVVVCRVRDKQVEILESRPYSLGPLFAFNERNHNGNSDSLAPSSELPVNDRGGTQSRNGSGGEEVSPLRDLLASVSTPWTSSILIVPAFEYLSLNLDLPFRDSKNVERIIDLEVQDLVPFDVSEFLLEHRSIGPLTAHTYDVHVSMTPRGFVRSVLEQCQKGGLEPVIVSTPASAIGAIYFLAPDYFRSDSAAIFVHQNFFHLTACIDGEVRADRVIPRRSGHDSDLERTGFSPLSEIRLTLSAVERRYNKKIERVYCTGDALPTGELQQILGRIVERFDVSELVGSLKEEEDALASLGSVFVQDHHPPPILTNFRTREFSYSPQLKELLTGMRSLAPLALATLCLIIVAGVSIYLLRELRIGRIRSEIGARIREEIPDFAAESDSETAALDNQLAAIESELKDFGSHSRFSPLDLLAEISADLPPASGFAVNRTTVRDDRIIIEGSAPDYSTVDRVARPFEQKSEKYCKVDKDTTGGSGNTRVTFTIRLCE